MKNKHKILIEQFPFKWIKNLKSTRILSEMFAKRKHSFVQPDPNSETKETKRI